LVIPIYEGITYFKITHSSRKIKGTPVAFLKEAETLQSLSLLL